MKGQCGRDYLKMRQLKPETIKQFDLGYAPDGWSNLLEAARARGVDVRLVDIRTEIFDPRAGRPDYDVALERVDAVAVSSDGVVSIKQGKPEPVCPIAPEPGPERLLV